MVMLRLVAWIVIIAVAVPARQVPGEAHRRAKREAAPTIQKITLLQQQITNNFDIKINPDITIVINNLEQAKTDVQQTAAAATASTADQVSEQLKGIDTAITGVASSLTMIQDKDPYVKAQGILKALSAISAVAVPGPYGAALSSIFSVGATLVGVASGQDTSTGGIVKSVVNDLLNQKQRDGLKDKISGTETALDGAMVMLKAYMKHKDHTATDMTTLGTQVDSMNGLRLLGELKSYIERDGAKAKKKADIQSILGMVKAYALVSSMRLSMLSAMHMIYSHCTHTCTFDRAVAASVAWEAENGQKFINSVLIKPSDELAHIAAEFRRSEQQEISHYMDVVGVKKALPTDALATGCYNIKLESDSSWYLYSKDKFISDIKNTLKSDKDFAEMVVASNDGKIKDKKSKYVFTKNGDFFEIRNKEWANKPWHVTKTMGHVYLKETRTVGEQELFRIVMTGTNKYYMVNKMFPGNPVKRSGNILTGRRIQVGGDAQPGEKAFWSLVQTAC